MANINQGVPTPSYPLVDSTGKINPVWFQFLTNLWQRTGAGNNLGDIQATSVTSSGMISGTSGKFTGTLQFGAYAAGTFNQTGYIFVNDANGVTRRLMVG